MYFRRSLAALLVKGQNHHRQYNLSWTLWRQMLLGKLIVFIYVLYWGYYSMHCKISGDCFVMRFLFRSYWWVQGFLVPNQNIWQLLKFWWCYLHPMMIQMTTLSSGSLDYLWQCALAVFQLIKLRWLLALPTDKTNSWPMIKKDSLYTFGFPILQCDNYLTTRHVNDRCFKINSLDELIKKYNNKITCEISMMFQS